MVVSTTQTHSILRFRLGLTRYMKTTLRHIIAGHLGRLCFSTNHQQNAEPYDPLPGFGVMSLSLYPVTKLVTG